MEILVWQFYEKENIWVAVQGLQREEEKEKKKKEKEKKTFSHPANATHVQSYESFNEHLISIDLFERKQSACKVDVEKDWTILA